MDPSLFEKLNSEGFISDISLEKIKSQSQQKLLSVHWELKIVLYLGVLLLTTGLGILVYENIDTIGHQAVLLFIALLSAGSYFYCYKKKLPFSPGKVESVDVFVDYLLLLSCICFVIFIGYWQYQYHIFGDKFGLATFIPMVVLFFSAYFFDHLGILCLAITNLAAWLGIVVTPTKILKENDFNSSTIIYTGLLLGVFLILMGIASRKRQIKSHFEFTYNNFGMHLVFISSLAGLFHFDNIYLLWFLLLAGISWYFYREAVQKKSFYMLLVLTLYFYIGLSYIVIHALSWYMTVAGFYLLCLYFIGSGTGLVMFLINMNKKLR